MVVQSLCKPVMPPEKPAAHHHQSCVRTRCTRMDSGSFAYRALQGTQGLTCHTVNLQVCADGSLQVTPDVHDTQLCCGNP